LARRLSQLTEPPSSRSIDDAAHVQTILLLKTRNRAGCGRIVLTILLDRNLCGREGALHILDIGSRIGGSDGLNRRG
jgi:hypothetical protein